MFKKLTKIWQKNVPTPSSESSLNFPPPMTAFDSQLDAGEPRSSIGLSGLTTPKNTGSNSYTHLLTLLQGRKLKEFTTAVETWSKKGSDVQPHENGKASLAHHAVSLHSPVDHGRDMKPYIQVMQKYGIDCTKRNLQGETPLALAQRLGYTDLTDILTPGRNQAPAYLDPATIPAIF